MKKSQFSFLSILSVIICAVFLSACGDRVPAGHVGIKVDKYGDDRGVQAEVLKPGRYWTGPNTEVFAFPTFTQTDKWQAKSGDGDHVDQSITFQAAGGVFGRTKCALGFC